MMGTMMGTNTRDANSRSPIEEEMDEWLKAFDFMAEAAQEAGFTTVVLMAGHDPLCGEDWGKSIRKGGYYAALGLLDACRDDLKSGDA
jgi:hypothetical protein